MPYLNSEVFYRRLPTSAFGPEGAFELVSLAPRAMALAVEQGDVDAGPLPVAEVFRMENLLSPLGDLCVATRDEAASVLLFARRAAEELDGATVGVTDQTSTSVQLLRVLLAELWRVTPGRFVSQDAPCDAVLLIGDDALRARGGLPGHRVTYDLGKEWRTLTGLPMVFATWVVRREVDARTVSELRRMLEMSLGRSLREIGSVAAERRDVGLTDLEVVEYLGHFIYRMGPDERRALETFREAVGRLPRWRPGETDENGPGATTC